MNKRINDSIRRTEFVKNMHEEKSKRQNTKQQLMQAHKDVEEHNRSKFRQFRS